MKNFVSPHAEPGKTIADLTGIAQTKWDLCSYAFPIYNEKGDWIIMAWATSAITIADFNALPTGSVIFAVADGYIHVKQASTTWVSEQLS